METLIFNNIVNVLIRLDNEAHEKNVSQYEYARRGFAIANLSNRVIKDFGMKYYLTVLKTIDKKLSRSLSPLDISLVKKLKQSGYQIEIIECLEYQKVKCV